MKSEVLVSGVNVNLRLGTIISKFFCDMQGARDMVMGGFTGSFLVDENLYHYINQEIKNRKGMVDYGNNPDDVPGTNFRLMMCKLYASIVSDILQSIPITDKIVSARYLGSDGETFKYEVEHIESIH